MTNLNRYHMKKAKVKVINGRLEQHKKWTELTDNPHFNKSMRECFSSVLSTLLTKLTLQKLDHKDKYSPNMLYQSNSLATKK